jgi:D-glycero-alpha-D-manno-heptose 1-phosphate guanylyltransferase
MEAIILAGGLGKRLKSVIKSVPKPMANIKNIPFLEIILNNLAEKNFKKIILAVGYKYQIIVNHFGNNFKGMHIDYSIESEPLGTGGAIKYAYNKINDDHFYVFNGDTFLDLEINNIERSWSRSKKSIIVGCKVKNVSRYGKLCLKGNIVTSINEKTETGSGLINAGCYVLNTNSCSSFPDSMKFSFEDDYLPMEVSKKNFQVYITNGIFIDIGIPSDYINAQNILKNYL